MPQSTGAFYTTTCLTTTASGGRGNSGEKSAGEQVFRSGKGQMWFKNMRPEVRTRLGAGCWEFESPHSDQEHPGDVPQGVIGKLCEQSKS